MTPDPADVSSSLQQKNEDVGTRVDGERRAAGPAGSTAASNEVAPADGAGLIAAERRRQIDAEGWTAEHDDEHVLGEMVTAAMCYAIFASFQARGQNPADANVGARWPWQWAWWKPDLHEPVRNLQKAGALIAAEIDRLQRRWCPTCGSDRGGNFPECAACQIVRAMKEDV